MSRHTVLFVDDDPNILDAMSRALRKRAFDVKTAPDGLEAIQIMQTDAASVIVVDHAMPNMSGTELLHICKERWPDTIRIMLTGGSDLNVALGATFSGWVYQYLEKPISASQMTSIIEEAVGLRQRSIDAEYARLLISPDAQSAMVQQLRVTSSPDRPTFAEASTPLDWALQLCETNILPPELDRLRPVIYALKDIGDVVAGVGESTEDSRERCLQEIKLVLKNVI